MAWNEQERLPWTFPRLDSPSGLIRDNGRHFRPRFLCARRLFGCAGRRTRFQRYCGRRWHRRFLRHFRHSRLLRRRTTRSVRCSSCNGRRFFNWRNWPSAPRSSARRTANVWRHDHFRNRLCANKSRSKLCNRDSMVRSETLSCTFNRIQRPVAWRNCFYSTGCHCH